MIFPKTEFRLKVLEKIPSTNALLFSHCDEPDFHGQAVLALHQSDGYGRRGRQWVSAKGNLALSLGMVLPTKAPISLLTFVLGLALYRVCSRELPKKELQLKWPNDLYFQGKKLAGMLTQVRQGSDRISVVMGIGLNLLSSPFPETSIAWKDFSPPPSPQDLAKEILQEFSHELSKHTKVPSILKDWEERARLSHILLRLENNGGEVRPLKLLPTGELLVTGESGEQVLASEDVSVKLILPSL
jgi:BirA family transcriptional regulator, biotin operon repressor / biotin---[acetyl-CoA-carboxylase] ligase